VREFQAAVSTHAQSTRVTLRASFGSIAVFYLVQEERQLLPRALLRGECPIAWRGYSLSDSAGIVGNYRCV